MAKCDGCGREGDLDQRVDFPATRDGRAPMLCAKCQGNPTCELEGDTDPCGKTATKEVSFPEDHPKDGWLKACADCIDRREGVFKMEFREIQG